MEETKMDKSIIITQDNQDNMNETKSLNNNSEKMGIDGLLSYSNSKENKMKIDKPNIIHYKEKKRIITIAFVYNKEKREIRYGACIFRFDDEKEKRKWIRKNHNCTALERFNKHPVIIKDFENERGFFRTMLRSKVRKYGVKSRN